MRIHPITLRMSPPIAPSPHFVEYIVIFVYMIFLAAVGPLMRKFNSNSDDYFRGGARTAWWLMGPSLTLSMVSAYVFTGVAGAIYEAGIAPLASNLAQYVAAVILILFLAAWFRQMRMITGAEVVRERFGPVTEQFFAYLSMILQPIFGAFQLLGLSIFVGAVFQIPLEWVVVGLGIIVGVYSVSGGKWAVMATDFLQSLVLFPVIITVCVLGLIKIGGVSNLYHEVSALGEYAIAYPDGAFPDGKYTISWMIAIFSMQFVAQLQLGWSARFFTAKDGREAQKAAALMLAIMLLGLFFFTVPAFISRVLYADQVASYGTILNKAEESAYVVACLNLLPNGLLGLVLVAMFSATASSMDTGLNGNAATIVRNVMPPLRRRFKMPRLDPQTEMVWGRRVSAVLAVMIVGITLLLANFGRAGIFELIIGFAAAVNFPMTLPFFLALFIRSAPRASALYSIIFGLAGQWVAKAIFIQADIQLDYAERVLLTGLCSVSGFLLSYVFHGRESPAEKEKTRLFYEKMHKPVHFESEVGKANDKEQLKTIGGMSMVIGLLMLSLLIIPNDWQARLTIMSMGASVLLLGALMVWLARTVLAKAKRADGPSKLSGGNF